LSLPKVTRALSREFFLVSRYRLDAGSARCRRAGDHAFLPSRFRGAVGLRSRGGIPGVLAAGGAASAEPHRCAWPADHFWGYGLFPHHGYLWRRKASLARLVLL